MKHNYSLEDAVASVSMEQIEHECSESNDLLKEDSIKRSKKADWKSAFKPVELTDKELKDFLDQCQKESEYRKYDAEKKARNELEQKKDAAKSFIYEKLNKIEALRKAAEDKAEKTMTLIYKIDFEYRNAGILSSRRATLKRKLDALWSANKKAWREFDKYNDQCNSLWDAIHAING